ncbi:CsbD family protein [Streptomyces sp. NPDC017524]|uniref:CsbD family protein n=1 Tax=unclassified Streptomyces TaxID=2593676 RepID=UPI0037AB92E3
MSENGAMDKMKGKGKEAVGKLTGDRRKEAEGKADQAKGGAKDAAGGVGERAKGVKDSLRRDDDK